MKERHLGPKKNSDMFNLVILHRIYYPLFEFPKKVFSEPVQCSVQILNEFQFFCFLTLTLQVHLGKAPLPRPGSPGGWLQGSSVSPDTFIQLNDINFQLSTDLQLSLTFDFDIKEQSQRLVTLLVSFVYSLSLSQKMSCTERQKVRKTERLELF